MSKKHKPPKCPNCKKLLDTVNENMYERYEFDKKYGIYKEQTMGGNLEVKCPYCNEDISDLFPEGACNFSKNF